MRAFVLPDFERQPTLADIPTPEAGPGEVLVRASSLNGFDLSVAAGRLQGMIEYRFPVVVGKDFAGTIAAVGADATRFAVGDPVFGVVMKPYLHDGAFGEYLAVAEGYGITRMPEGLDVYRAGGLGLAGAAAWDSVEAVAPAAGEAILISGASGGVGAFAVQLAAARGATVIGTAKPGEDSAFVRNLGAGHVVDYTDDLAKQVRAIRPGGVDGVIHLAGDAPQLADLLIPGGRFASTLGVGSDQLVGRDVRATAVMANPEAATLDRLAADVVAGRLRVPIQRTYRLDEIGQAMADFAAGTRGKLAVSVSTSRMRTQEDSRPVLAIVGAGPGMGLAIAKTFGANGCKVGLLSRNPAKLHPLVAELAEHGIEAAAFALDVLDRASIAAGLAAVQQRFGQIDVLEFSPFGGTLPIVPPTELTHDNVQLQIDFYVHGAVAVVNQVLPGMRARGSGTILFTTGASSVYPNPMLGTIGPATAWLRNWAHALHAAVAAEGVQVGHVAINARIGLQPGATPEAIAPLYWELHTQRDEIEKVFTPSGGEQPIS